MATRRWQGDALPVAQITTITIADTWATSDTATLTINGKDLVLTVGTDATTTAVATALKEMFNGDDQTGTGDHTFSTTGDLIPEFNEITATSSSAVLTLTSDSTVGEPFTITVAESTAGDGTVGTPAEATAPTGPHHFDNADNWSGSTVPVDGDDVVFDAGSSVDLLYALDQNGVTPASVTITQGYTGNIGLPETNGNSTLGNYFEYRDTYLKFCDSSDATNTAISIGEGTSGTGSGSGSGRLKLDCNDGQVTVNIFNSGQRAESAVPAVLLKGTHTSNVLNVNKGDIGVAFFAGESAHLATLNVGYVTSQAGDSSVVCGSGVDIANATITQTGGTLQIDSATGSGTITIYDGTLEVLSGAHASITLEGGTCYYRSSGTLTTANVGSDSTLDFRQDNQARTVTNTSLYERGAIYDPFKTVTWTNGIDLQRTSIPNVEIDLGHHYTITPSSI